MQILIEDYNGDQVTCKNVKRFDFDGETGELLIVYNDEPLTTYAVNFIKKIKYEEV